MSALKVKASGAEGVYDLIDEMGFTIGQVMRKTEHYNIRTGNGRNGVTTLTWLAWFRGSKITPQYGLGWARRRDAVTAIQERFDEEGQ